jgi:hypothetical protein
MRQAESFFPTAARLKVDDIIYLSSNLGVSADIQNLIGQEALVHSVIEDGENVSLSLQIGHKFIGTSIPADTPVELKPPF